MQRFFSRISDFFWLWTILGVSWAWWNPEAFTWFATTKIANTGWSCITLGLGIIMLGMGMTLKVADFQEVFKRPKIIFIGVVMQFVLMPFLGWSVATLFGLPPWLALGVILVSCCPGGTASNVICYLAKANVALSVLMTMVSTLLAVVLTPVLTKWYAGKILEVDQQAMIMSMLGVVLVPLIAGGLLNRLLGKRLDLVKSISPLFSMAIIIMIVGAVIGLTKEHIITHRYTLLPAVFVLHAAGFAVAYYGAKLLRLGEKNARTLSIEVGMQNSGLGSQLAKQHFHLLAATPCAISAVYHCLMGSFLAAYWSRKETRSQEEGVSDSKL